MSEEEIAALTESPETAVVMTAHDGQKYFCSLPPPMPAEGADDSAGADGAGDAGSSSSSSAADTKDSPSSKETSAAKAAKAARIAKKASERDGKLVTELLEPLGTACFYRIEGWWTYEFCHKKKVRQYHQDGETITSEYSLGGVARPTTIDSPRVVHSQPTFTITFTHSLTITHLHTHPSQASHTMPTTKCL